MCVNGARATHNRHAISHYIRVLLQLPGSRHAPISSVRSAAKAMPPKGKAAAAKAKAKAKAAPAAGAPPPPVAAAPQDVGGLDEDDSRKVSQLNASMHEEARQNLAFIMEHEPFI
eukprot:15466325-Alexandrium_andersonii.AAC.1